ncbi:hypothetical protein A2U01_0087117, partial [Trifolium medium]|nr:hypothetical protein [Trifolium medium]
CNLEYIAYLQVASTANFPHRSIFRFEQFSKKSRKGMMASPIIVVKRMAANTPLHQADGSTW